MVKIFGALVTFLVIFDQTSGFYLNDYSQDSDTGTYTVANIIQQGILQAIVEYFRKYDPPVGAPPAVHNLNEASLLRWIYGESVPTKKLASAISAITGTAMRACSSSKLLDDLGFFEEGIYRGHAQLQILYQTIEDELARDNRTDSGAIRVLLGTYLCGLVSFYSNTNWVPSIVAEGEIRTYEILGIPGENIMYVARPYEHTCKDCIPSFGANKCRGNLITGSGTLTSAYRPNLKPLSTATTRGKCGLGSPLDTAKDMPARGGIDKCSREPALSPHWFLHDQAGQIAVRAVINFLVHDVRGIFRYGDPRLRTIMELVRGRDLLFAVDTTGSMKTEIAAVKQRTIEIATKSAGSPDAPKTYTIVEFNDPAVQDAYTASDIGPFVDRIESISIAGGGDCPEMALTGMIEAINAAESASSTLFVFTDAPAKDAVKERAVITIAKAKSVAIVIFVAASSGCDMAIAANKALYRRIADETGGELFFSTSDADFNTLLGLIDIRSQGGLTTIYQTTVIKAETVTFTIDVSVKTMLVVVSAEVSIVQNVQLKRDSTGEFANVTVSTSTLIIFELSTGVSGTWSLSITNPSGADFRLEVRVSGQTDNEPSFEMYEELPDGTVVPVIGTPKPGDSITVRIDFHGDTVIAVIHYINLRNALKELIARYSAVLKGDGSGLAKIIYPNVTFTIEVEAEDKDGNVIKRVDTTARVPAKVNLRTNSSSVRLLVNETMDILIWADNHGGMEQSISLYKEDSDGVIGDIRFYPMIPAHGSTNISVSLYGIAVGYSSPTITVTTGEGETASLILNVVITKPPPPTVTAPPPTTTYPPWWSGAGEARISTTAVAFTLVYITMVIATLR